MSSLNANYEHHKRNEKEQRTNSKPGKAEVDKDTVVNDKGK